MPSEGHGRTPLRERAEKKLRRGARGPSGGDVEARRLIHELQVHKVELELQNEELQRIRQELEEALDRFRTLYDSSPVGYCTLDRSGRIREINLPASRFLGKARSRLIGERLSSQMSAVSQTMHTLALERLFSGNGTVTWDLELPKRSRGLPKKLRAEAIIADEGKSCFMALIDISEHAALELARDAARERQRELSQRLVAVQEEERRRLSEELHDHTSGNLAALDLLLATLAAQLPKSGPHRTTIGKAKDLLRATAAEIRTVCSDLRPPALDFAGIVPAIEEYAKNITERFDIAVKTEFKGDCQRLSPETISTLFRIVQEALTNCGKHSKARHISIKLERQGEKTLLEISDDGVGFAPRRVSNSRLGLRMMRERAEFAGGLFNVTSSKRCGTSIHVEFPDFVIPLPGTTSPLGNMIIEGPSPHPQPLPPRGRGK